MNRKPVVKKARKVERIDGAVLDEKYLMEVDEVAELLRKKTQTIRNWVARREFPFVQVGNKNLFKRSSVMRWLDDREYRP